jgi:hypothetical protein
VGRQVDSTCVPINATCSGFLSQLQLAEGIEAPDDSSHVGGVGVDLNVDLDPTVEVDGSEAVRTRLTPPPTSTQLPLCVEARGGRSSTSNVDRGLNVVRRRQSFLLRNPEIKVRNEALARALDCERGVEAVWSVEARRS